MQNVEEKFHFLESKLKPQKLPFKVNAKLHFSFFDFAWLNKQLFNWIADSVFFSILWFRLWITTLGFRFMIMDFSIDRQSDILCPSVEALISQKKKT